MKNNDSNFSDTNEGQSDQQTGVKPSETELSHVLDTIERCSDGDLTARISENVEDDQLAMIAREFNHLMRGLSETLDDASQFGDQVCSASDHVEFRVGFTKETSKQVSKTASQLADERDEQKTQLERSRDELERVSSRANTIADSSAEIASSLRSVTDVEQSNTQEAAQLVEELESIEADIATLTTTIESIEANLAEIETAMDTIDAVAEETRQLTLNTLLRSSRAHATVSDLARSSYQINNLATVATSSIETLDDRVTEIRSELTDTRTDIEDTRAGIDRTADTAESVFEECEALTARLEQVTDSVETITTTAETQTETVDTACSSVDEVTARSTDIASNISDLTDLAQEQTTSLTEVESSVSALSERASTFDTVIDDYEVTTTQSETHATVLEFWHAMGGEKALLIEEFISEFEAQADGIRIDARSKGNYRGTFDTTLSAIERETAPAIAQLYEIGTKRALDCDGFVPLETLFKRYSLHPEPLLESILEYYRTDGLLYSLPFNVSTPMLYYNRTAFERAGLSPDSSLDTFADITNASSELVAADVTEYGITFANYSWFIEQWFAQQNQLLVDETNGRNGHPTSAFLDSEAGYRIFDWIHDLESSGYYYNPGIEARKDAIDAFQNGTAGMLIASTSSLSSIIPDAEFQVRTGYVPVPDERTGVVVGGGSLWVAKEIPAKKQEAAAKFLSWLAEPAQQVRWHKETGYLPINKPSITKLAQEGWFERHPGHQTAIQQLLDSKKTAATTGARMGPFNTVRTLIAEAIEDTIPEYGVDDGLSRLNQQVEFQLQQYGDRESDQHSL